MPAINHAQFIEELADAMEAAGLTFNRTAFTAPLPQAVTDWLGVNVSRPVLADRVVRVLARIEGAVVGEGEPDSELGGLLYFDLTGMMLYARTDQGEWDSGRTLGGEPGAKVELQKSATHVQWRYEGDEDWTDLVALSALTGEDGREVELSADATHILWRLTGGEWAQLVPLSALKGADGRELGIRVSGGFIQTRLGTDEWANLFDLSLAVGPQGPQGEGLHYDASGPFAERSDYDAEDAGFVFASTDGADGLGGVAVLYKRVGASGWGDPVEIQGEKGDKGEDGNLVSLEGFVPYATIVTGSGAIIPGASITFAGTSPATLDLDYETPEKGDTYAVSNSGSATATLNAGLTGVFRINPASPLDAGDTLVIPPGRGVELHCDDPVGPVFSKAHKE